MYRIYWLNTSDNWILYSVGCTEDMAYKKWNECCDKYPHHKVKLTKETTIKEV